jgi:outer membrane protein assembly factor BamB
MSNPQGRSQSIIFLALLSAACLLLCGLASAEPSITLSKKTGPPTSRILVSGRGFAPNAGVDIYFDTKDQAVVATNSKGEFHDAKVHVPRSARPGKHTVKAVDVDQAAAQQVLDVQTDWRQFHRLNMTRFNPYENVLSPENVGHLRLRWNNATGIVIASPVLLNGVVYFGTEGGEFYALDARGGLLLWEITLGGDEVFPAPAVLDGIVYVSSEDGLLALDAATGTTLWKDDIGGIDSPTVVDGVVYVASGDNTVYAVNANTGSLLWKFATGSFLNSSPAVANGVVYVGSADYNVYALNASDGSKLWNYTTGNEIQASPAVANGVVYISSGDRNLYALNAKTGSKMWSYGPADDWAVGDSAPAVWNGIVYAGGNNGMVALAANTGELLWSFTTGSGASSPAVANGVVYFGSGYSGVYAVDARTGTQLWKYFVPDHVFSSPIVANGMVYVGGFYGFYAFSLPK